MIIDAHTHMIYGRYLDKLALPGEWGKKCMAHLNGIARTRPHLIDLEQRIGQLDRNGIDFQVVTLQHVVDCNLLPGDAAAQLAVAKALNDNLARLMEDSKGRLIAVGCVPLAGFEPGGRQELERAMNTLGLKWINLPSNLNGKPLDLPEFEPFWAYAAANNIPVFIHPNHPASPAGRTYEAEYDLTHNFGWPFETTLALARLVFSGIMERYPNLKVVSHHLGGGMIPFFMGRTIETYDSAGQPRFLGRVLPKPLFEYFSKFYYDTAVGGSAPAIRCAYEVFGADQLLFATDAPWGPGTGEGRLAEYPKIIRSLGLSEKENQKIFSENTRKLLRLR